MAKLTSGHDDLTAMMTFMRDEVSENVAHVERKIPPGISARRRNVTIMLTAK